MAKRQCYWKNIELKADTAVVTLDCEGELLELVFDSVEQLQALGLVLMGATKILSEKQVH